MRTWVLTLKHERCGNCWREIPPEHPAQLIEIQGVKARKLRCPVCAVGPVDWKQIQEARQAGQTVRDLSDGFSHVSDSAATLFDQNVSKE